VWLRASERISVMVFGICHVIAGHNILARRRIDMIHGEIIRLDGRPRGAGKVRQTASTVRAWDERNDLCAHENPSHSAIATRPANASDIRYAVMPACSPKVCHCRVNAPWLRMTKNADTNQMRGMSALARSFQARTLSPKGGRVPSRSRAPAKSEIGSDGGARQGALRLALRYENDAPCGHRPIRE
jgi:hypothetical protein